MNGKDTADGMHACERSNKSNLKLSTEVMGLRFMCVGLTSKENSVCTLYRDNMPVFEKNNSALAVTATFISCA